MEANTVESASRDKMLEIYRWASENIAETTKFITMEDVKELYYWREVAKILRFKLQNLHGQLIIVKGLQGTGKTRLAHELKKAFGKDAIFVKWLGKKNLYRTFKADAISDEKSSFDVLQKIRVCTRQLYNKLGETRCRAWFDEAFDLTSTPSSKEPSGISGEIVNRLMVGIKAWPNIAEYGIICSPFEFLEALESKLSQKTKSSIDLKALQQMIADRKIILIDLRDYTKRSFGKLNKDLDEIQIFWEYYVIEQGRYVEVPNVVLFIQKEILPKGDHYLLHKGVHYDLKPLTKKELMQFYVDKFGSMEPFAFEALQQIAILSRGVFRCFMRYIERCIEKRLITLTTITTITLEDVNNWITTEIILNDMSTELTLLFRNPVQRKIAVNVLMWLAESPKKGPDIAKRFFAHQSIMTVSRFLSTLESAGYVKGEYKGSKEKVWSLV